MIICVGYVTQIIENIPEINTFWNYFKFWNSQRLQTDAVCCFARKVYFLVYFQFKFNTIKQYTFSQYWKMVSEVFDSVSPLI